MKRSAVFFFLFSFLWLSAILNATAGRSFSAAAFVNPDAFGVSITTPNAVIHTSVQGVSFNNARDTGSRTDPNGTVTYFASATWNVDVLIYTGGPAADAVYDPYATQLNRDVKTDEPFTTEPLMIQDWVNGEWRTHDGVIAYSQLSESDVAVSPAYQFNGHLGVGITLAEVTDLQVIGSTMKVTGFDTPTAVPTDFVYTETYRFPSNVIGTIEAFKTATPFGLSAADTTAVATRIADRGLLNYRTYDSSMTIQNPSLVPGAQIGVNMPLSAGLPYSIYPKIVLDRASFQGTGGFLGVKDGVIVSSGTWASNFLATTGWHVEHQIQLARLQITVNLAYNVDPSLPEPVPTPAAMPTDFNWIWLGVAGVVAAGIVLGATGRPH
jgi:hypothetical protein